MNGEFYDYDSYEQASDYCNNSRGKNRRSKSYREQKYESMGNSLGGMIRGKFYENELYKFIKSKKMDVDWELVSKYLKPQYFEEFKDLLDWDIVSEENCFLSDDHFQTIHIDCKEVVEILLKLKEYVNWESILKKGLDLKKVKKLQDGIGKILAVQRIKGDYYMVLKPTFYNKILMIRIYKHSEGYTLLEGDKEWFEVGGVFYKKGAKYHVEK